ncbi:MAG: ATP-binding cassette domain-containing protein [Spirochaetaceae bacterium]|nr:MAG: ATP-binding cassette domain-containing protein [Spirochaetaceae bacterium]
MWWIGAAAVGREILLPSPARVLRALLALVLLPHFASTVIASLTRWLAGFLLALTLSVLSGTVCSRREWAAGMLRPLVVVVRSVPVIAVILLALIWLPVDSVPVFISLLVSFPLLHQGVLDGLRSVDPDLVDMGRLFHVPVSRRVRHIHIPGSLPVVLSALTGAVGMSWKAVIAAEVLSQPVFGIGTDLHVAKLYLETPEVIAWTVVAVLLAAAGDGLVWAVDRRVNAWRTSAQLRSTDPRGSDEGSAAITAQPFRFTGTDMPVSTEAAAPEVRLESVSFGFRTAQLFENLTLEIPAGSVTAVLGRSGCGKTTLLRLIAGDLRPDSGSVTGLAHEHAGLPAVGFVFQEPRLLPWRSVLANVELVLPTEKARISREARRQRIISLLRALRLSRVDAYPSTLSGGMRHRVNLARGFISGAPVICMDEPFANQDIATRRDLVALTRVLESHLGRSVILVTHDPEEAFELADRIIVLADRQPTSVIANYTVTNRSSEEIKRIRAAVDAALNGD